MKTIYQSYELYSNKDTEAVKQEAKTYLLETYDEEEVTEELINDEVYRENEFWYEDEKRNLDKELDGRILAIADLGLWDGRHQGYKILGKNLNEVLSYLGSDYIHVYFDGYNVKADQHHHDGTNYITFREIREDKNIDVLLQKIYDETVTPHDITNYTKGLRPAIKEVYGW